MSKNCNWETEAIKYAEEIGVYEFKVHGKFMEYWSFFGKSEGWYFVRYDIEKKKEVFRGANIPWDEEAGVPAFLDGPGGTLYNYFTG